MTPVVCEICEQKPGTIHLTEIVNKVKSETHLCTTCAQTRGLATTKQTYFVAKLFNNNPRFEGSCLIRNGGNDVHSWGTTSPKAHAHRFKSQDTAYEALQVFFGTGGDSIARVYTSGRVFKTTEEPVGPVVRAMPRKTTEKPQEAPEAPQETTVTDRVTDVDIEGARALLDALVILQEDEDARPKRVQEARLEVEEWFIESADDIFAAVRERDALRKERDALRKQLEEARETIVAQDGRLYADVEELQKDLNRILHKIDDRDLSSLALRARPDPSDQG